MAGHEAAHQVAQFVWLKIERRPDIEEHAIPVQAFLRPPSRLKRTDGCQRFHEHALQMWQLHDASGFITHGSHIAHLGTCKQTFVFGIVAGNGMEEIDVFDGGQPIDLEIAEPPEVQALPHHGVQSAVELRLFISISGEFVSEVLQSRCAGPGTRARSGNHDALDRIEERQPD